MRRYRSAVSLFPLLCVGAAAAGMALPAWGQQPTPAVPPPPRVLTPPQLPAPPLPQPPKLKVIKAPDGSIYKPHYRTLTSKPTSARAKARIGKAVVSTEPTALGATGVKNGTATVRPFGSKGERVSIMFSSGEYVPPAGQKLQPAIASLAMARSGEPGSTVFGMILLNGRLDAGIKSTLTGFGVKLLGFYPNSAWLAEMPSNAVAAVASLPEVRWVGQPNAMQKLSADLRPLYGVTGAAAEKQVNLIVSFYGPDQDGSARATLTGLGVKMGYYEPNIAIQA
ncbi:MAG TPA: hypothetical protein VGS41_05315, partial [Chthonomonadales bacterium]|nr:hypothetical protein [Chthonomonadales bacterium]